MNAGKIAVAVLLFVGTFSVFAGKTFAVAANGKALGHIAVDVNAPRPVYHAARELQNYIKLISGGLFFLIPYIRLSHRISFID